MMFWLFGDAKRRRACTLFVYAFISVCAAVTIACAAQGVVANARAAVVKHGLKALSGKLQDAILATKGASAAQSKDAIPVGNGAQQLFQANAERAAIANGCRISDTSTGATEPYAPHIAGPDATGLSQIHVQMSISGPLQGILSMLSELSRSNSPCELVSTDFSLAPPDPKLNPNVTLVNARVEVTVVAKGT